MNRPRNKLEPSRRAPPRRTGNDQREAGSVSTTGSLRQGGIRLVSPIELTVLEGDRCLGSSAGPIFATAGTHQLELVNSTLGYSVRQTVTFPAGQIGTLSVSVPNGRLSANCQPGWAELYIDQKLIGETPMANISLPPGQHEVLFRHPKLGDHRETVIVRPDTLTRVAWTFDQ